MKKAILFSFIGLVSLLSKGNTINCNRTILTDSFSTSSGWQSVGSGAVNISNGKCNVSSGSSDSKFLSKDRRQFI